MDRLIWTGVFLVVLPAILIVYLSDEQAKCMSEVLLSHRNNKILTHNASFKTVLQEQQQVLNNEKNNLLSVQSINHDKKTLLITSPLKATKPLSEQELNCAGVSRDISAGYLTISTGVAILLGWLITRRSKEYNKKYGKRQTLRGISRTK